MNSYTTPQRKLDQLNTMADRVFEEYFAGLDYAADTDTFALQLRSKSELAQYMGESRGVVFLAAKQSLNQYAELES